MKERKIPVALNCGLDLIAEVLYGKWKMRLLYFIHEGHLRPGELLQKIPGVSRRVLHMQLKELEEHALVEKKIYAQLPPKVEYRLTALGTSLIPVISAIGEWADEHQVQLRAVITKTTDMPEPDTP